MSNGSSGGAIKAALELIAGAIGSGGKTRKDLLASASQMASAIQTASAVHIAPRERVGGEHRRELLEMGTAATKLVGALTAAI